MVSGIILGRVLCVFDGTNVEICDFLRKPARTTVSVLPGRDFFPEITRPWIWGGPFVVRLPLQVPFRRVRNR